MENGSVAAPRAKLEPRRGPTLFERVTGTGRARDARPEPQREPQREPTLGPARETVRPPLPSAPKPVAPKPMAAEPVLEPVLETAGAESQSTSVEGPKPQRPDDDLLDIPAFLRRQTT
jgi:hypothetical protein